MKEQVMVLKVKLHKVLGFIEMDRVRLLDNEEMENFTNLVSAFVSCGYEIKVEMEEMGLQK